MTNDLLVFSEWIIQLRPLSSKRLVAQRLVRPQLVVIVQVRRDKIVEVLLAKDREEIQAFYACGLYPSLDEGILIWRSRCRGLHSAALLLKDFIEFFDVHVVAVANKMRHFQARFTSLRDHGVGLTEHPLAVGFETAGRTKDSPATDVNKRQDKRLSQSGWRPDHLAEEVDLPQSIDMEFEKLVPSPTTSFGTRLDTFLLEDVLNRRSTDTAHPQFSQFSQNSTITPASFTRQSDDHLTDRFRNAGPSHLFGLSPTVLCSDPTLIGSRMDDRDEFWGARTDSGAQLKQSLSFVLFEEDLFQGNSLAEHDILRFEEIYLPTEFVFGTPGER